MFKFKVVYNDSIQIDELKELLKDYEVEYFNDSIYKERKLGFKIKGAFASTHTPFIGVYKDDKPYKGFYSEVGECNVQFVKHWIDEGFKK